jgi:glutamate-5-semialdehyde dehydrogenase
MSRKYITTSIFPMSITDKQKELNMFNVLALCRAAKDSSRALALMPTEKKNEMLKTAAEALINSGQRILEENRKDVEGAKDMPKHFIDRLTLTPKRIDDMAMGLNELIKLNDPVGEVMESFVNHCGLEIKKVRVPLGVIGIIYEARPNVTADAIGLCIKSGNCVILRGSKDAILSNKAIVGAIKEALERNGYDSGCIGLVEDTTRKGAEEMMAAVGFIDALIPRGGAGLIKSVVENSKVPVIETGCGNCHVYVEKTADVDMAVDIIINAKTQRPSVCNAAESLLVDEEIAPRFLPRALKELSDRGVEIRGCSKTKKYFEYVILATREDYYTEYNDLIISVKVVKDINEAIDHIEKYSTRHSDAIVTSSEEAIEKFFREVDSAAVYANASTRFTDGFEFGFGAEMGISTQKLHARGPMGLKELTSYKYIVKGNGQLRK